MPPWAKLWVGKGSPYILLYNIYTTPLEKEAEDLNDVKLMLNALSLND